MDGRLSTLKYGASGSGHASTRQSLLPAREPAGRGGYRSASGRESFASAKARTGRQGNGASASRYGYAARGESLVPAQPRQENEARGTANDTVLSNTEIGYSRLNDRQDSEFGSQVAAPRLTPAQLCCRRIVTSTSTNCSIFWDRMSRFADPHFERNRIFWSGIGVIGFLLYNSAALWTNNDFAIKTATDGAHKFIKYLDSINVTIPLTDSDIHLIAKSANAMTSLASALGVYELISWLMRNKKPTPPENLFLTVFLTPLVAFTSALAADATESPLICLFSTFAILTIDSFNLYKTVVFFKETILNRCNQVKACCIGPEPITANNQLGMDDMATMDPAHQTGSSRGLDASGDVESDGNDPQRLNLQQLTEAQTAEIKLYLQQQITSSTQQLQQANQEHHLEILNAMMGNGSQSDQSAASFASHSLTSGKPGLSAATPANANFSQLAPPPLPKAPPPATPQLQISSRSTLPPHQDRNLAQTLAPGNASLPLDIPQAGQGASASVNTHQASSLPGQSFFMDRAAAASQGLATSNTAGGRGERSASADHSVTGAQLPPPPPAPPQPPTLRRQVTAGGGGAANNASAKRGNGSIQTAGGSSSYDHPELASAPAPAAAPAPAPSKQERKPPVFGSAAEENYSFSPKGQEQPQGPVQTKEKAVEDGEAHQVQQLQQHAGVEAPQLGAKSSILGTSPGDPSSAAEVGSPEQSDSGSLDSSGGSSSEEDDLDSTSNSSNSHRSDASSQQLEYKL